MMSDEVLQRQWRRAGETAALIAGCINVKTELQSLNEVCVYNLPPPSLPYQWLSRQCATVCPLPPKHRTLLKTACCFVSVDARVRNEIKPEIRPHLHRTMREGTVPCPFARADTAFRFLAVGGNSRPSLSSKQVGYRIVDIVTSNHRMWDPHGSIDAPSSGLKLFSTSQGEALSEQG